MDVNHFRVKRLYREYLKGKKVVLVGPSASIIGQGQGSLIDSYDVVVRLNQALPIPSDCRKDLGTRTDVLYSNLIPENCEKLAPFLKKAHLKFVIGAYPPIEQMDGNPLDLKTDTLRFYKTYRHQFRNFTYFDSHYFKKLWKIMGLPNTGTAAILDLLKSDLKELFITGITFFHDGYYSKYKSWSHEKTLKKIQIAGVHQLEAQWTHMRTILTHDPRIRMDEPLQKLCTHFTDKPNPQRIREPVHQSAVIVKDSPKTDQKQIHPRLTNRSGLSNISSEKKLSVREIKLQQAREQRQIKINRLKEVRQSRMQMRKNYFLRKKQTRKQLEFKRRARLLEQKQGSNRNAHPHKTTAHLHTHQKSALQSHKIKQPLLELPEPKSVNLFTSQN